MPIQWFPGHMSLARKKAAETLEWVDVVIEGEVDPERGWVMDFAEIDEHAQRLVRRLDHQVLNEIEGLTNPTSELHARWWWDRLVPTLPSLFEVIVSETVTSRCVYRGGSGES